MIDLGSQQTSNINTSVVSNNDFLTSICLFGIATFQWSIEWVTY
jgi:hypothetical protein